MKSGNFGGFDIIQNTDQHSVAINLNPLGESYNSFIGENTEGKAIVVCMTEENIKEVKNHMLSAVEILDKILKD